MSARPLPSRPSGAVREEALCQRNDVVRLPVRRHDDGHLASCHGAAAASAGRGSAQASMHRPRDAANPARFGATPLCERRRAAQAADAGNQADAGHEQHSQRGDQQYAGSAAAPTAPARPPTAPQHRTGALRARRAIIDPRSARPGRRTRADARVGWWAWHRRGPPTDEPPGRPTDRPTDCPGDRPGDRPRTDHAGAGARGAAIGPAGRPGQAPAMVARSRRPGRWRIDRPGLLVAG